MSWFNTIGLASFLEGFETNDVANPTATLTYVGKQRVDGKWMVQSIDSSSGTEVRYATIKNNPTYATYAAAWLARASLIYGVYADIAE